MDELREKVVNVAWEALCDTDDMSEMSRAGVVADRILAIPEIAEGLEFVRFRQSVPKADYSSARQANNLGHSISTNPPKPGTPR